MTPHPHQRKSIAHLLEVLPRVGAAVDASEMGVGKTLTAVEVMRQLDLPTLVVCPKAVVPAWKRTAAAQGTDLDAINYELVRRGSTSYGSWWTPPRCRKPRFRWNSAIKFLIFDEAHRLMSSDSLNSDMARAARRQGISTLLLSATLADTPLELDAIGYLLRLHDSDERPTLRNLEPRNFYSWARQHGCGPGAFQGWEFRGSAEQKCKVMLKLNAELFPSRGVRITIEELGGLFPETQITTELVELEAAQKIEVIYAQMAEKLAALKLRTDAYSTGDPLVELLAERQKVELLKVPAFVSIAQDALAQGMSVAIFVNFRLTLQAIAERLKTECVIDGSQVGAAGAARREANRVSFQSDSSRVIVCIGDAGGVGLDLHDVTGRHPRLSLISPGFNAKLLRQILGRVRRIGGLTKSLQRILFAAGTCEEGVHRSLSGKLDRLDSLQDADLLPNNLQFSH